MRLRVRKQMQTKKYDQEIHRRQSIRLKGYDYSQAGAYFVTVCTHRRALLFGEIANSDMMLNEYGHIVETEWMEASSLRGDVELDIFAVMPNHFHGILVIADYCEDMMCSRGTVRCASTLARFGKLVPGSLSSIVRSFKSAVTKRINTLHGTPGTPVWQRNYYEHVIRNGEELNLVREYIMNNPANWDKDEENPIALCRSTAMCPSRRI